MEMLLALIIGLLLALGVIALILYLFIYFDNKNTGSKEEVLKDRADKISRGEDVPFLVVTTDGMIDSMSDTGFTPHIVGAKSKKEAKERVKTSDKIVAIDMILTRVDTPYYTYGEMDDAGFVHYYPGVKVRNWRDQ